MSSLVLLMLVAQQPASPAVRVPLDVFTERQTKLERLQRAANERSRAPGAVVGETIYRGRSEGRFLRFTLEMTARFPDADVLRSIPVLGRDAVVLSARHDGVPIALIQGGDHWVWHARARGRARLVVDFVVAPTGPRGSIEYRFGVAESPVTELSVDFGTHGLSPQIAGAVTKRVSPSESGTRLDAILKPTRRIHIVGLHDVEKSAGARAAKVYGETHNLVSLSDESIELFSVVDFTILYAPAKRFRVELPAGYDIVSADGQGAFHYTIETVEHKPVLVGETAFGMRDHYEISIRLKRALSADEKKVQLPVPRLPDVERDTGYVAIEVPGKLSVEAAKGEGLVPLDVRELPQGLVMSAVSPVVRAFRYADRRSPVWLEVARYPERALASGGVDELSATSVITTDGRVMTDARFELRNVLEQYLALELAEGAEVQSAAIDGNPLKPSRDDKGRVLLPLVRSKRDGGRLVPFEVQIVYRTQMDELGAVGRRSLVLPKLEVPISSLEWNVYVPGGFETTSLGGPVAPQRFVKNASWHDSGLADIGLEEEDALELAAAYGIEADPGDAGSGAMPVRVRIPKRGKHLAYHRYWVDAGQPTEVRFGFVRSPVAMIWSALGALALAGMVLLAWSLSKKRGPRYGVAVAAVGVIGGLVFDVSFVLAAVVTAVVVALRADGVRRVANQAKTAAVESALGFWSRVVEMFERKRERFAARREQSLLFAWSGELVSVSWLMFRLVLLTGVGIWFLTSMMSLVDLLSRPI